MMIIWYVNVDYIHWYPLCFLYIYPFMIWISENDHFKRENVDNPVELEVAYFQNP